MNKLERELAKLSLAQEKAILKELEKQYNQAIKDIDDRIAALLIRKDIENMSSIIYQLNYQNALKAQIGAILDNLQVNQYVSISDYLRRCYEDGFIGVLYSLQSQGVPLLFPINQEQMVRAIMTDTKLSTKLYNKLGEDIDELKKSIRYELSRGISNNYSYDQISQLIGIKGDIYKNKAFRIARTEGHRINQEATYDSQKRAKSEGADIVKQWDATLDKRTRRAHAELDGQLRDVDEFFTYNGHKALYPSGFSVASLDINCRCVMLQRAKWAISEEEIITKMNEGKVVDIPAKDYQDFKNKYFNLIESEVE